MQIIASTVAERSVVAIAQIVGAIVDLYRKVVI